MTLDRIFEQQFENIINSELIYQTSYDKLTNNGKNSMLEWFKINFIGKFFEEFIEDKNTMKQYFKYFEHKDIEKNGN